MNMEDSSLEPTHELFEAWIKNYEETFGKMAQIPTIGPMREKSEKISKGLPLFFNLYGSWLETVTDFQTLSIEAAKRMNDKTAKLEGPINQDRFRDLYNIWIESYSDTFKEFLKSGHFAKYIGKFTTNVLDVQRYNREMLEENYLKPSNFPTKTDIDEINRELHSLRKQVKELNQRVNELSNNE